MIPVAFMYKQMQQRCLINKLYLVHFELFISENHLHNTTGSTTFNILPLATLMATIWRSEIRYISYEDVSPLNVLNSQHKWTKSQNPARKEVKYCFVVCTHTENTAATTRATVLPVTHFKYKETVWWSIVVISEVCTPFIISQTSS